ncbi:MAG: HAD-IB family hydrolase, partial [Cyanobacteria bacterium REEB65]|nr:HAD-IB family hydrolase [Cyanobacteria bacterium REEB65]
MPVSQVIVAAQPPIGTEEPRSATFFDFDGTLADTNLVHGYAYYARHSGHLGEVTWRLAKLAALAPTFHLLDAHHRMAFARTLFGLYAGLSHDRLVRLSERLHVEVIAPRIMPATAALLDSARQLGPIVLVTGAPDFAVAPFAREAGFAAVLATRLEFRGGRATGRILEPAVFGTGKATLMRRWARQQGMDLADCRAYADSLNDQAMLQAAGRAGLVNPTRRQAAIAKDSGWQ